MAGRRRGAAALAALLLFASVSVVVAGGASAGARTTLSRARSGSSAIRTLPALQRTLLADLHRAGGASSAVVADETTGQTLFSVAPTAPRLPASVEKLYTTSAALLELGPAATFTTSVLGAGSLTPAGVWRGDLYLRGGGDPTFGDAHFDAVNYGTGATVQQLVAGIRHVGIRQVDGSIIGDESYLDALRGTPATGYRPSLEVEGQLDGLSYDAGFQSHAEDSLQPNPTLWATDAFASVLNSAGVRIPKSTKVSAGTTPASARLLASISSPPLARILELTNSPSDNFFAEMLLKDLGASLGRDGTTANGAAVVRAAIAERLGLHPLLNDGSGLSRFDRTTAADVVTLLQRMQSNPSFMGSLAIAGVRGTMQHEMVGTRAVGNCRGKTGTLIDVANLVGYCTAANGNQLVFAFLLNSQANSDYGHAVEDLMGEALANYDAGAPTRTTTTPTRTTPTTTTKTTTTKTTTTRTTTTPRTTTLTTPTITGSGGVRP